VFCLDGKSILHGKSKHLWASSTNTDISVNNDDADLVCLKRYLRCIKRSNMVILILLFTAKDMSTKRKP
jgi:hypothetical protein